MIPPKPELDALEVFRKVSDLLPKEQYPFCRDYPLTSSPDSYSLYRFTLSAKQILLAGFSIPKMKNFLLLRRCRSLIPSPGKD